MAGRDEATFPARVAIVRGCSVSEGKIREIRNGKNGRRNSDERLANWRKAKESQGVDWKVLPASTLKAALSVVMANGGAIMFGSALGGTGVMVKLFLDGDNRREYVQTADDLAELLELTIELLGSGAEDVRLVMAGGAD